MILRASLINAQSTVALVKFFVTCVRIRRIIYEILCYPVIYWRALYVIKQLTLKSGVIMKNQEYVIVSRTVQHVRE